MERVLNKSKKQLTINESNEWLSALKGYEISRAWNSIGSMIFLELGETHKVKMFNEKDTWESLKGEYTIMVGYDWRFEKQRSIWFSSVYAKSSAIVTNIEKLVGLHITTIQVSMRLPELQINIEDKIYMQTVGMLGKQPNWVVFNNNHKIKASDEWLCVERGSLYLDYEKP